MGRSTLVIRDQKGVSHPQPVLRFVGITVRRLPCRPLTGKPKGRIKGLDSDSRHDASDMEESWLRVHVASVGEAHVRWRPSESGYAKPQRRPKQNCTAEASNGQHESLRNSPHAGSEAAERGRQLKLVTARGHQEKTATNDARDQKSNHGARGGGKGFATGMFQRSHENRQEGQEMLLATASVPKYAKGLFRHGPVDDILAVPPRVRITS